MKAARITVYDTTLRDGAQAEGVSFTVAGKIKMALRLDAFGVDYIEGGYAGSNQKDMDFFSAIRKYPLKRSRIVAFGSTRRAGRKVRDDSLLQSLLAAQTGAVTIFGKAWILHVRDVLRTTPRENLAMISDTVAYLKDCGREVFFDAEHFFDGYKADASYAMAALEAAVRAGADAVVLCDTNGGALPAEIYEATRAVVRALRVPVGIHVHNDGGMAVANTVEAVRAGAVHVQGTVNGIGERCGNADLCAVLPSLEFKMGLQTVGREALRGLKDLSVFADTILNRRPDSRAPYVGQSAFSHKAGPHVDAVNKNPRSFEHVKPEDVGNRRRVLVSELSGGTSVLLKAIELGVGRAGARKDEMRQVLAALKRMEAKGYAFEAADGSFKILVQKALKQHRPFFDLEGFRVIVEKRGKRQRCVSEATVKVRVKGEREQTAADGDGPVNALDRALRKALTRFYPEINTVSLADFRVSILDPEEATAAKTRVIIESTDGEETWGTVGVSGNIIEASWEALVDSVEYKLFKEEERRKNGGGRKVPAAGDNNGADVRSEGS